MTTNQIQYQAHLENVRHNKEMERQGVLNIDELVRHQKAVEGETARSNLANEFIRSQANAINASSVRETARANQAREGIQWASNYETQRSNLANEEIRRGANAINAQNAETNEYQAAIADYNAQTQRLVGLETARMNKQHADLLQRQTSLAERETVARERQADARMMQAEAAERNADTSRMSFWRDTIDTGLNYVIPKKGALNGNQGSGSERFKDAVRTIRTIKEVLFE